MSLVYFTRKGSLEMQQEARTFLKEELVFPLLDAAWLAANLGARHRDRSAMRASGSSASGARALPEPETDLEQDSERAEIDENEDMTHADTHEPSLRDYDWNSVIS